MASIPRLLGHASPGKIAAAIRSVIASGSARPERWLARSVLERGYRVALEAFVLELRGFLEPISQATIVRDYDAEAVDRLNAKAVMFRSDRDFNRIWKMFARHFGREVAVAHVAHHELDREVDEDAALQLSRNLNHCWEVRQAIVTALIENLTRVPGYDAKLQKRLEELTAKYRDLGMRDLLERAPPAVPPAAT